jgi:hypothetical protein
VPRSEDISPPVKSARTVKPATGRNWRGFGRNRKGSGGKSTAGRVSRAIFYGLFERKQALYHTVIAFIALSMHNPG